MLGMLENEKDRARFSHTSLEEAYALARDGKIGVVLMVLAASVSPCECGGPNDNGFNCVSDAHAAMRRRLLEGFINEPETTQEQD